MLRSRALFVVPASVLTWFLAISTPVLADYDGGLDKWDRGDIQGAVVDFRAAGNRGDPRAQDQLGVMYEEGQGLTRDDVNAVYWYEKAAAQDYPPAQLNLARMYRNGKGVTQDESKAVYWYTKAAEKGLPVAQFFLGLMYDTGKGVPSDPVRAYMWFSLAGAQGDQDALFKRERIAVRLTADEIAQASRMGAAYGRMQPSAQVLTTRPEPSTYERPAGEASRRNGSQRNESQRLGIVRGAPRTPGTVDSAVADRPLTRSEVKELQQRLNSAGYSAGTPDGLAGPRTRSAVQALWQARRLLGTGGLTLAALDTLRKPPPSVSPAAQPVAAPLAVQVGAPTPTATVVGAPPRGAPPMAPSPMPTRGRALVREIQSHLTWLGFDAGPADGLVGKQTRRAARNFRVSMNYRARSTLTPNLLRALMKQVGSRADVTAKTGQSSTASAVSVPVPTRLTAPPVGTALPVAPAMPPTVQGTLSSTAKTAAVRVTPERESAVTAPVVRSIRATPVPRPKVNPFALRGEALVREFQHELTRLGYDIGPVDGVIGRRTVEAVKSFQHGRGWRATGRLVPAVLKQMQLTVPARSGSTRSVAAPQAATTAAQVPARAVSSQTSAVGRASKRPPATKREIASGPPRMNVPRAVNSPVREGALAPGGDRMVLDIQRRLNQLGYRTGVPDGLVGRQSVAATKAFQRSIKRSANGILGGRLLRQLDDARARGGLSRTSVKETQRRLVALGHPTGGVDGFTGSQTVDAVRAFQRVQGLPEDGRLSNELLDALRRASAQ
jgi:peptidoglycan hydrolase-like protein with peptidoglycan-binding domain